MKAFIVDLSGQRAAALCEDGSVREVKNLDYNLGDTITIDEMIEEDDSRDHRGNIVNFRKWYRRAAAAAALILMLTGIGGATAYAMPYGEVSLDAGTSVTYTINRFDFVISAKASDESGEQIIAEIGEKNLVNRKVESALAMTLDHIKEGSESEMEIHVRTDISGDESRTGQKHAQKLQDKLEKVVADKVPTNQNADDEVPIDTAPEEPGEETEESPAIHPGGQSEGSYDSAPPEPASGNKLEEEQDELDRNSQERLEENAEPANGSEEVMENMQKNSPAGSENMSDSGNKVETPEEPQGQFEEPSGQFEELPENGSGGPSQEGADHSMNSPGKMR